MSGGAVTLQAPSHVAKYSGLDEALHCRSSGCGEGLLVYHRVDKLDLLRFVPIGASCLVSAEYLRLP